MKHYILLSTIVSILCAGPMVEPLVDYDAQDVKQAKILVPQKVELSDTKVPIVTAPGVRVGQPKYELDALVGRNFADNDSLLKDATTIGLRINKYMTENFAIQFGYDRIFNADYKFVNNTISKLDRSVPSECTTTGCLDSGDNDSGDSGTSTDTTNGGHHDSTTDASNTDSTDNNTGSDNSIGDNDKTGGSDSTTSDPLMKLSSNNNGVRDTDVDRFYINGLKEMHIENSKAIPYVFAGLGYEYVNDKNLGIESQGFFNAGGGLKYSLNEKFRLISEAKAIKKFRDSDLDIVALVGVGMLFGKRYDNEIVPEIVVEAVEIEDALPKTPPLVIVEEKLQPMVLPIENSVSDTQYFIQVAVIAKESSLQDYIVQLEQEDIAYEIRKTAIKNKPAHLILAGPYVSHADAKQYLPSLQKIEKDVYIRKITN